MRKIIEHADGPRLEELPTLDSQAAELTQLREDLARAEGEGEDAVRDRNGYYQHMMDARARSDEWEQTATSLLTRAEAAEQERDTLKAECERLIKETCYLKNSLASAVVADLQNENDDLRAQLAQAEEARKLCAVQMKGLDEEERERERLATEAVIFKQANGEMHEMIMQVRRRFKAWDTPHSPVGQDIVDCVIRHADEEIATSREEGYRAGLDRAAEIAMNRVLQADADNDGSGADAAGDIVDDIRAAIAESSTLPLTHNQEGCLCQSCGERYTLDVSVPDSIWEQIKPEGKPVGARLICPQCIINRVLQLPYTYEQGAEEEVEDKEFCCPECDSFDVYEIAYEDDFGSMECKACGYQGDPGEDFPSRALPTKEG